MQLVHLTWHIDPKGYRLIDRIQESGDRGLVVRNGEPYGPQNSIRPMDIPAVHHLLAETPDTPEGALDFIQRFGFLFKDDAEAEGVEEFILAKRFVEQLLKTFIRVQNDVPVLDWEGGEKIGHEKARQAAQEGRKALNEMFSQGVKGSLGISYEYNKDNRPEIIFKPSNLFHAIVWLAFQDFTEARDPKKCKSPSCTEWFYYGPGTGKRNTAVYCSRRCEKAHAYERLKASSNRGIKG